MNSPGNKEKSPIGTQYVYFLREKDNKFIAGVFTTKELAERWKSEFPHGKEYIIDAFELTRSILLHHSKDLIQDILNNKS